jgi:hypothetical protein
VEREKEGRRRNAENKLFCTATGTKRAKIKCRDYQQSKELEVRREGKRKGTERYFICF